MIARRLRRRFRLLSVLPFALWAWKERHVLGGMAGFARTVPDRVKLGRSGEIGLAAKVHWALLRDESLKGANLRLGAIQGGDVCLEVAPGSEAAGERARRLLERVPGVTAVRLEGCEAVPAVDAGTATTVAGDGEVATAPVRV